MKVLVVEDDKFQRDGLGNIIQESGHNVHFAENGYKALNMVEDCDYSLIFIDCNLPIFDGLETAVLLRETERMKKKEPATIVGLGINGEDNLENECNKVGMNFFLTKPFDTNSINQVISRMSAEDKITDL